MQANVIVAQEVEKRRIVIEAEAEAEQKRVQAKGEADAIFAKMGAEAEGLYEILTKQAEGYDKMIRAAGGDTNKAYMLLLLEKLPELVRTQVEAIKGINIDKVTIWDNGGQSADGKGSTANFVSGLLKICSSARRSLRPSRYEPARIPRQAQSVRRERNGGSRRSLNLRFPHGNLFLKAARHPHLGAPFLLIRGKVFFQ